LKFKKAQNSKNLRLNGHTSFEFQTRNYIMFGIQNFWNYIMFEMFRIQKM